MSERCDICGLVASVGPHGAGVCTPAEHHKISETVVPYVCSQRDCEHWALGNESECPTEVWEVCEECSRESWAEGEGPVTTWDECRLRPCTVCGGVYLAHWDHDHDWEPNRTDGSER